MWDAQDFQAMTDAISSHAMVLGMFDRVNAYEPKGAPGNGLTCSIWLQDIRPLPEASGMNSTTVLVSMQARCYQSMTMEPLESIDPNMAAAASALIGRLTADYTLDGLIRNIDLQREFTQNGLCGEAGYVDIDHKMNRVITIDIPCVVNDMWEQAP